MMALISTNLDLKCVVFLAKVYNFFAEYHFEDSRFYYVQKFYQISPLFSVLFKSFIAIRHCFHLYSLYTQVYQWRECAKTFFCLKLVLFVLKTRKRNRFYVKQSYQSLLFSSIGLFVLRFGPLNIFSSGCSVIRLFGGLTIPRH